MLTSTPQWVAVYTNPRAEKRVAKNLEQEGYEAYLPIKRELHTWSDRKKWVETPLLKSYVFAKITMFQESLIRRVSGVSALVSFDGEVATIPEAEIQMMKDFLAADVAIQVRTVEQLRRGKWVKIVSGGLEGKVGMLVSDCEDGNFAVEITGISMAMVVHVDQEMMELAEDYEIPESDTNAKKQKKYTIR